MGIKCVTYSFIYSTFYSLKQEFYNQLIKYNKQLVKACYFKIGRNNNCSV